MTDVSVQMSAAAVCVFLGMSGGILYEGVELFRFFVGNRIARAVADAAFFLLVAVLFTVSSAFFCLPSFRLYQVGACMVGFLLYRKSLHRILAFFARRLYNKCRKIPKEISAGACDERR